MLWMPMDKFWIALLATLVLLHQTILSPVSTSDTEEVFGAVGRSVTFHIQDTSGGEAALWNFEDRHLVTVSFEDPPQAVFSKQALKARFAVSEKGRALSISQLRLEDAGTYSVTIEGKKRSAFILHVYRELAEPTVTCEAQNCSSDGSCRFSLRCSVSGTNLGNVSYTWRVGDRPWSEGSVVLWVNKSSLEEPLTCTAQNPVSSRNVTVSTPDLLCTESSTHSPSLGSHSSSRVVIGIITAAIGVVVLLSVVFLFVCKCKGWKNSHSSESKLLTKTSEASHKTPQKPKVPVPIPISSTTIYAAATGPPPATDGASRAPAEPPAPQGHPQEATTVYTSVTLPMA